MSNEGSKRVVLDHVTQSFRGGAFSGIGGELVAVDDVSFDLSADPPRIVSLVGESGSGKSTIARIILGLQKPSGGGVTYNGRDVYGLGGKEFAEYRHDVQAVFQDPYGIFNPFYRVDRIFWTAIKKFKLAPSKEAGQRLVEEALRAVDLRPEDVLGRYPHQLSGGQRQRVMLARVYMMRPAIIIADEPVSMLDAAIRVLFLNVLLDFKQKYGMTTLFITHDLSTAYYVGGDVMVISKGRIVESGSVDDVLNRPAHPYTQLLLSSLPVPDPDARWQEPASAREVESDAELVAPTRNQCLFSDRCPHVMPRCRESIPEMYAVRQGQAARCFLYDEQSRPSQAAIPAAATVDGQERR